MNIIKMLKTLKRKPPKIARDGKSEMGEFSLFLLKHIFVLICAGRLPVGINVAQLSRRLRQREGEGEEVIRLGSRAIHRSIQCVGLGLELHAKSVDKAFSQLELNERTGRASAAENWNSVSSGIEQGLISGAR